MMMDVRFDNTQLFIEGHSSQFQHPIKSIKVYKDLVLVLLHVPKGIVDNRNAYAVDMKSKQVKWRIEEPDLVYESNPYINFYDTFEHLIIGNWNGISYLINEPMVVYFSESKPNEHGNMQPHFYYAT